MTTECKVESKALAESLTSDFQEGPIFNEQGQRLLTEELVTHLNGLKIEIFSNEHPPPHFRVYCAGETENFTIKNCIKLNGALNKWERNVRAWHKDTKLNSSKFGIELGP